MKQILNVNLENNYKIFINNDDLSLLIDDILKVTTNQKRLFVISEKVYKLYKNVLQLDNCEIFILKDGEEQKNLTNYARIVQKAIELNLTRKDVLIAIGGGVVGDITGFVASTYMRGIDFIQVPTTLLSMVDSSVGGKTAIDMENAKNIIGSFYQPKAVFININFLKTLDKRQFMSGIGEILKYAFIENNCGYKHSLFLFEYLTLCCEKLLQQEPMTLARVIEYCLNLKIAVVAQDEKEGGLRKILNLGHTLAHALEAKTNYRKFTHGEAVVIGMYFIFNWAYTQNLINYSYYRLAIELLDKYGFDGTKKLAKFNKLQLVEIMKHDKKANANTITFVVPCDKKVVKTVEITLDKVLEMF